MTFDFRLFAVVGVPADNKRRSSILNKNTALPLGFSREVLLAGTPTMAKDGVPQFASREVNAGETGALNMDYRSMSIRDLREELKRLNI